MPTTEKMSETVETTVLKDHHGELVSEKSKSDTNGDATNSVSPAATPFTPPEKADSHPTKVQHLITRDPIKWFGILIPRELRAAQGHFDAAFSYSIGQLATSEAELRNLEIEIRRTRKHLSKLSSAPVN